MPYVPRFRHLVKILFRLRDTEAAEGLWLEGTWLHDQGDLKGARDAFHHARLLDPNFAGAFYNYAALTERFSGSSADTIAAWKAYLTAAEKDHRQTRTMVEKVRAHVAELEAAAAPR